MAGIYLHVPFCSKKCNYCDFYSIVSQNRKEDFVKSLIKEISQRKSFLKGQMVETIYFGGGTPSLLTKEEISIILTQIAKDYKLSEDIELTFEANPENLTKAYLKNLKDLGVNRLSIGIQSFNDTYLQFLKRSHNSKDAIRSVNDAYSMGISNISIDLIYGLPNLSLKEWEKNLSKAFELPIKHLSSYHLTYEQGTLLYKRLKQGRVMPINEDESIKQFELLIEKTFSHNFEYYEISNFAIKNFYSKHNLSYWQQKKYLGLGPSAHSYNGTHRFWNVSNLLTYIEGVKLGANYIEEELLSKKDIANEYILTNLRTKWGLNTLFLKDNLTSEDYKNFIRQIKRNINQKLLKEEGSKITLSPKGIMVSDLIIEGLFIV